MPVKRRQGKARHTRLEHAEWLSLEIDEGERDCGFASDEDRREAWEAHRAHMIGEGPEGKRSVAWWDYDAPAPRDPGMHETLQLYRLGVLTGDELAKVMAGWAEWAPKARRLHWGGGPRPVIHPGPVAEDSWRRWAGIPDELFREP